MAGSLSWAGASISRTLFLLVLITVLSGYGYAQLNVGKKTFKILVIAQLFLLAYSWGIYLNHYPKRGIVIRDQQCGYKELTDFIDNKYNSVSSIYITAKHGQPYIFQLFYSKANPTLYQKSASLSAPDQYGFGQVLSFDKFRYTFPQKPVANALIVGYPDDFTTNTAYTKYLDKVKKLSVAGEEIFWIVQTDK